MNNSQIARRESTNANISDVASIKALFHALQWVLYSHATVNSLRVA